MKEQGKKYKPEGAPPPPPPFHFPLPKPLSALLSVPSKVDNNGWSGDTNPELYGANVEIKIYLEYVFYGVRLITLHSSAKIRNAAELEVPVYVAKTN